MIPRIAGHHAVGVHGADDALLGVGMQAAFRGQEKSRAHLHAVGPHQQRCRHSSAVDNAAGSNHRNRYFRYDIAQERHGGQGANMAATLHSFDDYGVRAGGFDPLGQLDAGYDRQYFDAGLLELAHVGQRIACAHRDKSYFFLAYQSDHFVLKTIEHHDVDAEGFCGQGLGGSDFIANPFYRPTARGDDACSAGARDGCRQTGFRDPGHAPLNYRMFDLQ